MIPRLLLSAAVPAAVVALAAPMPAAAQTGSASRMAETMRDPAAQQAIGESLRAMTDALLAIRIGPLVEAIDRAGGEPTGDVDPQATLGDFAGPGAQRLPDEMARQMPAMMGAMGDMAGAVEESLPQLRAIADEMRARITAATRD